MKYGYAPRGFLIDYFDKYDNANTLEETKAGTIGKVRTKFKKGDRVYLTSRNLGLRKKFRKRQERRSQKEKPSRTNLNVLKSLRKSR